MFAQSAVETFRQLLERLLPRVCQVCGGGINRHKHSNQSICSDCLDRAEYLLNFRTGESRCCLLCGEPMPQSFVANRCLACVLAPLSVRRLRSVFWYDDSIESAIKLMKYADRRLIASNLGQLIASYLAETFEAAGPDWPRYDMVAAIPSPIASLRSRRFSHTHEMAKIVATTLQLPLNYDLLVSTDRHPPQAGLSPTARRRNAKSAFRLGNGSCLKDAKVLVVDDVITTGSTINACSEIILAGGACLVDEHKK